MQLLDYLATRPNAKVRFCASDMVLNVHSDASNLLEPGAESRVARVLLWGGQTSKWKTNFIEWQHIHSLWNVEVHSSLRREGRTRSIVCEWKRAQHYWIDTSGNWPPTAFNSHTL